MEVNRALIATGTAGAVLATVFRATPLLANTLGALGLAACGFRRLITLCFRHCWSVLASSAPDSIVAG